MSSSQNAARARHGGTFYLRCSVRTRSSDRSSQTGRLCEDVGGPAPRREALALPQKRREIREQEIQELKSLLRKQMERRTESPPDSTRIQGASTNGTVPTAAVRQPALTDGNGNVGVKFTKTLLIAQGSYGVGASR
jgi:hypothetical protein